MVVSSSWHAWHVHESFLDRMDCYLVYYLYLTHAHDALWPCLHELLDSIPAHAVRILQI